jgi:soluble cytochrome b562
MSTPPALTPIQEAEQARQVVNVLARLETRIADGHWASGYRFGPDGGNCLIGAIDEATEWAQPGVAERAAKELAERLPAPFRALGRVTSPRVGLAAYNDSVGGRDGALDLVRRTRYALGGLPLVRFVDEPRPTPWTATQPADDVAATAKDAQPEAPDRVIDVTDRWVARQPLQP